MNLELKDQTAVIVGAARGIGHAIATAFARENANVVLFDRESSVGEAASALAKECGVRGLGVVADVANFVGIKQAAAQIGRVDHLVYAVGIGSGKFGFPFWNLEPGDWPRVYEVNVQGAVNVVHAFTPQFLEHQAGSVLLIASVAGQIGSQTD